jgi:hypothetical protein
MTRLGQKATHWLKWPPIIERAKEIVESIEATTGVLLTLRKLFYKLIHEQHIPNDRSSYVYLGKLTAIGRKAGTFPDLAEDKVAIEIPYYSDDEVDALRSLQEDHTIDHSATQPYNLLICCEKAGTIPFLKLWFHYEQHIRIVALGGESSVTTWQKVRDYIEADPREPLVIYLGDYDCTGFGIRSRFKDNLGLTDDEFIHVGLTQEQVDRYQLPRAPGKEKASGKDKDAFLAETGEDVQVELDALDEEVLHELVEEALAPYWDEVAYQEQLAEEQRQRERIAQIIARGRRKGKA